VLLAARRVDALVGVALASACRRAVFALALWASATWAVDSAAVIVWALVPFGTATV
jgi:hypothetical protein